MLKTTTILRRMLDSGEMIVAPGAFDTLSARVIEQAGFATVYMTGYGTAASMLGEPDLGLLTMSEMAQRAGSIAQAVQVPVIADADTGYGGPLNVRRTVRAYEDAGVAAIHIEDQVWPKKCGHMEGKQVISIAEMVSKIKAALDTRRDPDFLIIARTDARAVTGFNDAMARGRAYAEAGADIIFFEAPRSLEELQQVGRAFGKPTLFNFAETGKTPLLGLSQIKELGFQVVIYPVTALYTATKAMMEMMANLKREGTSQPFRDQFLSFAEFNTFIGLPEAQELEERYKTSG